MNKIRSTLFGSKKRCTAFASGVVLAVLLALSGSRPTIADDEEDEDGEESKIRIGFAIAPVELNLKRKNRALVGLGSYIVNAQSSCYECHTSPSYVPGGNPFLGQPEQINADDYLGGGRQMGPFVSANLTPDEDGLPAGMTYDEFELVMRTGIDRKELPPHVPNADNDLMQVMPWPVFRNMTERDLRAIYEFLSAIPSVP